MSALTPTALPLRMTAVLAAFGLCASLAACKTPLEKAWGISAHEHVTQSTANPDAGLHDLEARKPDGQSTDAATVKFRTREAEMEAPDPPPVINIDAN